MPSSCTVATARTTTSVSTVRTRILLNPRSAASAIGSIVHAKRGYNGSSSSIGGCATPAHKKSYATRGHDWGAATQSYRLLSSPGDWGWTHSDKWQTLQCGPIFLKPVYRAKNCCIAGAGRDAQTANVPRVT